MGHNQPHYGVRRWLAAERVDEFDDTCGLLLVMLDTLLCFACKLQVAQILLTAQAPGLAPAGQKEADRS